MLINKWLITGEINEHRPEHTGAGICLHLSGEPPDFNKLYRSIEFRSDDTTFALFFSGKSFLPGKEIDSYIEKLIGIFFLPAYHLVNFQPVVFLHDRNSVATDFMDRLNQKCTHQGIGGILFKEVSTPGSTASVQFSWLLDDGHFDLKAEIKRWVNENVKGNTPPSIDLFVPTGGENILHHLTTLQNEIREKEEYQFADALYRKQLLLEETQHQLYLKTFNEQNLRFYLTMQKKERADTLKWYYYEYEVLPTWFKQLGHIVKVIIGKRSFKSLFNDNVKKHND